LLTRETIQFPLTVKLPLFLVLVAVAAFFMGTLFPSGIRLIRRTHAAAPWAWAINGGAFVMGSILGMVVAMTSGYVQTLMMGCACYLGALLVILRINEQRSGRTDGEANATESATDALPVQCLKLEASD
jgi:hypothetical protein